MDPFWYIANCNHFEEATIHPFTPGFTFYNRCVGDLSHEYVQYILGGILPQKGYYFRIGYCPILLTSEYALSKTILFPGYRGTPEYSLIVQSDISYQEKSKLLQYCDGLTIPKLNETYDFRHMKWFHDNGITQVKRIDTAVYFFQEETAVF